MPLKRIFDIFFSIMGLFFLGWIILLTIIIASFDTNSFGLFQQNRVGQHQKLFTIFKIKTIHPKTNAVSKIGNFLRKYKIDEFPQLLNVLIGNMSFVGPRPDVQGYYDLLVGENRKILELKPGITCEASIKYANEEDILSEIENPLLYYDEVIFPDKVKLNLEYYNKNNLLLDIQIIFKTIVR